MDLAAEHDAAGFETLVGAFDLRDKLGQRAMRRPSRSQTQPVSRPNARGTYWQGENKLDRFAAKNDSPTSLRAK
jgi:hypothetical protein